MEAVNLHVYQSAFTHESRILKITAALAEHEVFDDICMIGIWEDGSEINEPLDARRRIWRVPCRARQLPGPLGRLLTLLEWFVRITWQSWRWNITCVNCHSLVVLPFCVLLKYLHGCKLIYDTHELETETASASGARKWLSKRVERFLLPQADAVVVVGEMIRDWYAAEYGRHDVQVVRNVPRVVPHIDSTPAGLRGELGIPDEDLLFLYQGVIDAGRGIEILLDAFAAIDPHRHVVFMGYGSLEQRVHESAVSHPNIHFRPAVPPSELHRYTIAADVGLAVVENVSLSYYWCLPNKVFEYLHAAVPAIVSDFPEMGRFVDNCGCGWKVQVNVPAVRDLIGGLTREEIRRTRANCMQARHKHQWEAEEKKMLAIYSRLFARPGREARWPSRRAG